MNRRAAGNRADGFTLFEALAATMILAIALVAVLQLFSGGLRAGTVSNQHTLALFHAREKMEEILLSRVLAEGEFSGRWDDGFGWDVEIARPPLDGEDAKAPSADADVIFTIHLTVGWTDGEHPRRISLQSLALAKPAVEPVP